MRTPTQKPAHSVPANDNGRRKSLGVEVRIPQDLPIQVVEVEVFAELLDSLGPAANDDEDSQ